MSPLEEIKAVTFDVGGTLIRPWPSVGHVYAGPMATETVHFVEAVALDRPVLVTPEQARRVMELYIAADLSAELNEPVTLPLENKRPARLAAGI